MLVAKVIITKPFDVAFDYLAIDVKRGDVVFVPLKNKLTLGVVVEIGSTSIHKNLKSILGKASVDGTNLNFNENLLQFLQFVSKYYISPIGLVLSMCLLDSKYLMESSPKKQRDDENNIIKPNLSNSQNDIFTELTQKLNTFSVSLLDGITGSGKTLVYFYLIDEVLKKGKKALIMLPEISLTGDLEDRIISFFGKKPVVWHSSLTPKQRSINYQQVLSNDANIILGARSSIMLPLNNLGLIVVDEEHDTSYKQEDRTPYQGRNMAIKKAQIENIPIILSSGTPSLESYNNARIKKYNYFHLNERFGASILPEIEIYDMRGENLKQNLFISKHVVDEISKTLSEQNQVLVFLNRRGFAPLMLCKKCGHRVGCDHCSSFMAYHHKDELLKCHTCGISKKPISICPACNSENSFIYYGPGVERIEQELTTHFKDAKIITLTSDILTSVKKGKEIFTQIKNKQFDIIIGTQLLAKGYNFPDITLVTVVDGDMGLDIGDVRSSEKTFQLLEQVSGRAGRYQKKGKAIIQTYNPNHRVFSNLKAGSYRQFLQDEIVFRKENAMPPFVNVVAIICSSNNEVDVFKTAKNLAVKIDFLKKKGVKIYGPAPSQLYKMKGSFRYRLLLIFPKSINLQEDLKKIVEGFIKENKLSKNILIKLDVDPYNFM